MNARSSNRSTPRSSPVRITIRARLFAKLRLIVRVIRKGNQDRCRARGSIRWTRIAAELKIVKLELAVQYPDEYPDALPTLELEATEGELEEDETTGLLDGMRAVGEENLGMAMTFTVVSYLREELSSLIRARAERKMKEAMDKERKALEEEEARTRGTPVTPESFQAWKAKFDKKIAIKKQREEEERLKSLTQKEKDEYKKIAFRLSGKHSFSHHHDLALTDLILGRQLFERDKNLATSDDTFMEEGTVSVDVSQYERRRESEDEEDDDRVHFSDSD
ncbi:hypothetical protein EWM64_g2999 [Hericium alpestre]|uniref:RWD domain-containing protein n=1 Tax=Hericium alpestre TaxID=135208 RepID=A0A4Z0A5P7_9AGAM|nr:hypothetical protein EWM64_g2999 [Hericium alpestre]